MSTELASHHPWDRKQRLDRTPGAFLDLDGWTFACDCDAFRAHRRAIEAESGSRVVLIGPGLAREALRSTGQRLIETDVAEFALLRTRLILECPRRTVCASDGT